MSFCKDLKITGNPCNELKLSRTSKLHLEFPNHHSEILTWNFQITIRSIGTHFRMNSKWFQMQGLDLILETSKLFPNYLNDAILLFKTRFWTEQCKQVTSDLKYIQYTISLKYNFIMYSYTCIISVRFYDKPFLISYNSLVKLV